MSNLKLVAMQLTFPFQASNDAATMFISHNTAYKLSSAILSHDVDRGAQTTMRYFINDSFHRQCHFTEHVWASEVHHVQIAVAHIDNFFTELR